MERGPTGMSGRMLRGVRAALLWGGITACAGSLFGSDGLEKDEAQAFVAKLWQEHTLEIRTERSDEMKAKRLELDEQTLRFELRRYGEKPPEGWSLFLSMHGGGGTPAKVNDSQWENQIRLGDAYRPTNALYVAPRAPTDTWNLWHRPEVDWFFDRLIENLVVLEDVNPNAVYVMGYSAGGDGVYQLATRMSDRFAGAAMMAGHPNQVSPLNLRNVPFALHVGAEDHGYKRNTVGAKWGRQLHALREADPEGYPSQVQIHAGKGHWMDLEDRVAVPWLQTFERNPVPKRVVWKQMGVVADQSYWLAVPEGTAEKGQFMIVSREGQTLTLETTEKVQRLLLRLNDAMLDLDQPVRVRRADGTVLYEGRVVRRKETARRTFEARRDPHLTFFVEIEVDLEAGIAMQRRE